MRILKYLKYCTQPNIKNTNFSAIQKAILEWKEKKLASLNSETEEKVEEEEENIYSVTLDDNVSECN